MCYSVNNTIYQWCMRTLAVSDKCDPEWLSISHSLQDWGLVNWEAASLVWSLESCVTAARCSGACMVHWKVQELSYRKQIARKLRTQFVEGISVTLKSTLRVTQGHWKRNHCVDHTRLTIRRVIGRWILSWPWNVAQRLKVIESETIWKFGYGFLTFPTLTLTITLTLTLTLGLGVKVIENGAVQ